MKEGQAVGVEVFQAFNEYAAFQGAAARSLKQVGEILNGLSVKGKDMKKNFQQSGEYAHTSFLASLEALSLFFESLSQQTQLAADQLNTHCLSPYTAVATKLETLRQGGSTSSGATAAQTARPSSVAEDASAAKLASSLERAKKEVKDAADRREELLQRFGHSLSNKLLDAAQARLDRALRYEAELREKAGLGRPLSDSKQMPPMERVVNVQAEALDATFCCMKRTVRVFDAYCRNCTASLTDWHTKLEAADVRKDSAYWRRAALGPPADGVVFSLALKHPYETGMKTLERFDSNMLASAALKVSRGQDEMANLINEQNTEIERLKARLKEYEAAESVPSTAGSKRPCVEDTATSHRFLGGDKGKLQVEASEGPTEREGLLQFPVETPKQRLDYIKAKAEMFTLASVLQADPKLSIGEQWWDIQKQYELFLLSLSEIGDLKPNAHWDRPFIFNSVESSLKLPLIFPYTSTYFQKDGYASASHVENPLFFQEKRLLRPSDWCILAYEMLLLCYHHLTSFFTAAELLHGDAKNGAPLFQRDEMDAMDAYTQIMSLKKAVNMKVNWETKQRNATLMRELIKLCRIKMKIPARTNRLIIQLTLPNGDNLGSWNALHPLDIRYRALKLLEAWDLDEFGLEDFVLPLSKEPAFLQWVYRQLGFINYSLYLRYYRMQKFVRLLPSVNKSALPSSEFPIHQKLRRLMDCFDSCEKILQVLFHLVSREMWGTSAMSEWVADGSLEEAYRGEDGRSLIVHLIRKMSQMEALDDRIRRAMYRLVDAEASSPPLTPMGNPLPYTADLYQFFNAAVGDSLSVYASDEVYVQRTPIPTEVLLSRYWSYDYEALQMILLQLFRCCTDPINDTKLNVNAPSLVQGILLASLLAYSGIDPTVAPCEESVKLGLNDEGHFSLSTISVLLLHALWSEVMGDSKSSIVAERDSPICAIGFPNEKASGTKSNESNVVIFTKEFMDVLLTILDNFKGFLNNELPLTSQMEDLQDDKAASKNYGGNAAELRITRLLKISEENALMRLFVPPTKTMYETLHLSWKRVDWSGLTIDEISSHLPKYFPQFALKSGKPPLSPKKQTLSGGLSVLLPSKIERAIGEALFCRVLTWTFREQLIGVLNNYRLHLDTQSLPAMLSVWESIEHRFMITNLDKVVAEEETMLSSGRMGDLPLLLRGPTALKDFYRSFIFSSVFNLFDRTCNAALEKIQASPTFVNKLLKYNDGIHVAPAELVQNAEEEVSEVLGTCGNGFSAFLEEVKCEIEFFTRIWSSFLSEKEHLAIVAYAGHLRMLQAFHELLNSPYWTMDALALGGSVILTCARQFELLFNEIALICGISVDEKSYSLFSVFKPSIFDALDERFLMVEAILDRCLEAEEYKPLNPPDSLYSPTSVDLLSFIHHAYDIVLEIHAPVNWVLPTFVKFLLQLSSRYSEGLLEDVTGGPINALMEFAYSNFKALVHPKARPSVPTIQSAATKKPSALFGAISKLRNRTMWRRIPIDSQKTLNANPGDKPYALNESDVLSSEHDDEGEMSDTLTSSMAKAKKRKSTAVRFKKLFRTASRFVAHENEPQDQRVNNDLTFLLQQVNRHMPHLSHLSWIVRLHNMEYFCEKLPSLARKFETKLQQSEMDSKALCRILHSTLESIGTRVNETKSEASHRVNFDERPAAELLEQAILNSKKSVEQAMDDVCKYTAGQLVFAQLQSFLFYEIYSNSFAPTLQEFLEYLPTTVEKYILQVPERWRYQLNKYFLELLIQGWCLIISEMGFFGHVYKKEEVQVLQRDLQALKQYVGRSELVAFPNMYHSASEWESTDVLFGVIEEFFVRLSAEGSFLAELERREDQFSDSEEKNWKPEGKAFKRETSVDPQRHHAPSDRKGSHKMKKVKFPYFL